MDATAKQRRMEQARAPAGHWRGFEVAKNDGRNMERKNHDFTFKHGGDKLGYGACGGAALSALFKVMIRQPFFHHARRHRPTLLLCFFKSLAN